MKTKTLAKMIGVFALLVVAALAFIFPVQSVICMAYAPAAIVAERKLFDNLKKQYLPKGITPAPSYLRIEMALNNSQGKYMFDIKKNGNEAATERKLDRNDLFVVTRIGVYLAKVDTTKIGLAALQTHANSTYFGTQSGFTVAHLEAIYNGYLSLKTGTKVNIEALSMQVFKYIQTSQQASSIANSEFNVSEYTYQGAEDIYLHGTKSHEITVEYPTFSGIQVAATAANTQHKLIFHPYGFLLKNAADAVGML